MVRQGWIRVARAVFALLTLAAIAYQFSTNSQREIWNPVNFFSFFTIQSNIIAAIVLLIAAAPPREIRSRRWAVVRGGATMYMATTAIVYSLLLSGLEQSLQTPTPWVNAVLHQVLPLWMLVDLLLRPISPPLQFRQTLTWLAYPFLYLVYTLVRGPRVDWYPYPFLDPREPGGYPTVAVYCLVILLGFLALSSLVVVFTRAATATQPATT